jgi:hypothetical protein
MDDKIEALKDKLIESLRKRIAAQEEVIEADKQLMAAQDLAMGQHRDFIAELKEYNARLRQQVELLKVEQRWRTYLQQYNTHPADWSEEKNREIVAELLEQAGIEEETTKEEFKRWLIDATPVEGLPIPWRLLDDAAMKKLSDRFEELREKYGEPKK